MSKCSWLLGGHQWEKWGRLRSTSATSPFGRTYQLRRCDRCGAVSERSVADHPHAMTPDEVI